MLTKIRTIHEEQFSGSEKLIGVLHNFSSDEEFSDSFIYVYNRNVYIFFNTIAEMIEYLLQGDKDIKRAYMKEEVFDSLYDNEFEGIFEDKLSWFNENN